MPNGKWKPAEPKPVALNHEANFPLAGYCTESKANQQEDWKVPALQRLLLAMLYPANLYMWVGDIELGDGASLSPTGHVVRLLLQIGGIILSLWIAGWSRDKSIFDLTHQFMPFRK